MPAKIFCKCNGALPPQRAKSPTTSSQKTKEIIASVWKLPYQPESETSLLKRLKMDGGRFEGEMPCMSLPRLP